MKVAFFIRLINSMLLLLPLWLLAACDSATSVRADLFTRFNTLGSGEHTVRITVPRDEYNTAIFSRFPDLSMFTGVRLNDYQGDGRRGIQISQSFWNLGQLSDPAIRSKFFLSALPGYQVSYQAVWHPGFPWRELDVSAQVHPISGGITDLLSAVATSMIEPRIILEMPGTITAQNGLRIDERHVAWSLNPVPRVPLEVRARVLSLPGIIALLFSLVSTGLLACTFYSETSAARSYRTLCLPNSKSPTIPRPVGRPLAPPRRRT